MTDTVPDDPGALPEPSTRSDLRGRIARGAGLAGLGFVLSRGLTFASYIVIAQLIAPRDAGQLAAGTVLVGLGLLFAESGMLAAIIHWKGDVDEAASTAFASTLVTGVLLTLIGVAAAPLVGAFFHSSTIGWVAAASSGWLFLRSLQIVPDALLQRRFSFLRRVAVDPLGALAFGITAIACCANGMGVWGLVLGTYALYTVQAVAAWGFVRWRPRRSLMSMGTWRQLAGYARHVVASEVVRRVTVQLDSILLGRFSGSAALGQYAYGLRLASEPTGAWVSVAAYTLLPAFARIADDAARFRRAFLEALSALCTISVPVALLLLAVGDQLALFAFGPEWPQSGDAVKALCGLGFGATLTSISSEVFKAAGRPQLLPRVHGVAFATSIVLLPSLLWAGVVGIGIAVSISAMITGAYALRHAAATVDASLGDLLRSLRGLVASGAIALAAVLALDLTVFADTSSRLAAGGELVAEGAVMALVYAAALLFLAPADAHRIRDAVARLRRRAA
jgi:PST family polysaccharide transporter